MLDVGCGDGTLTRYLDSSIEYYGIDVKPNASDRVVTLSITKDKFPFESGYFDYVVCTEVLEHIDNHQNCLGEIRRILNPDGLLLGTIPNCLAFPRIISLTETKDPLKNGGVVGQNHIVAFGYPEIRDLLRANAFNVLNQYYFYFILSNRVPLSLSLIHI